MIPNNSLKQQTPGKSLASYRAISGQNTLESNVLDMRIPKETFSLPVVNWKFTVMITLLNPYCI